MFGSDEGEKDVIIASLMKGGNAEKSAIYPVMFVVILIIAVPFLIGGGALAFKLIQILFFTKAGSFPVWAIVLLGIIALIIFKKKF